MAEKQVRLLIWETLQQANRAAIANGWNRTLDIKNLAIDKTEKYPIGFDMIHEYSNGVAMRCEIMINAWADRIWIDIPMELFMALPLRTIVTHVEQAYPKQ